MIRSFGDDLGEQQAAVRHPNIRPTDRFFTLLQQNSAVWKTSAAVTYAASWLHLWSTELTLC